MITKKRLIIAAVLAFVCAIVIGIVAYVTLKRLTFGGAESDEMRQKVNKLAVGIRKKLMDEHNAELVTFKSREGFDLAGLFIKDKKAECNVLLCHGYRSNKEMLHRFVHIFPRANFFLFDFRGHGQSEGNFVTIGYHEYKDVISAAQFFKKQLSETSAEKLPLIILGISMGGASAVKAVALEPSICDALVVDSAYADLWEVVSGVFTSHSGLPQIPFLPVMEFMLQSMSDSYIRTMRPVDYVKSITMPIFFIHSAVDDHTDPKDTLRMYANAKSTKTKLWVGPKTKHAKLHAHFFDTYKRKMQVFLNRHVFGRWK